jgi:hypothetical protein
MIFPDMHVRKNRLCIVINLDVALCKSRESSAWKAFLDVVNRWFFLTFYARKIA